MCHLSWNIETSVLIFSLLIDCLHHHASAVILIDKSTPATALKTSLCEGQVIVFEMKLQGLKMSSGCVLDKNNSGRYTSDQNILEPMPSCVIPAGSEFSVSPFDQSQKNVKARILIQPTTDFLYSKRGLHTEDLAGHIEGNTFTRTGSYLISLAISDLRLESTRFFAISVEVVAGYVDPSKSMVLYLDTNHENSLILPRLNETIHAGILNSNTEIARHFSHCIYRNCLILECRRFDAYGNRVMNSAIADLISIKVIGVERAADGSDFVSNLSDTPGESIKTFEIYQKSNGSAPLRGNIWCSTFQCPLSNIVLPNNPLQTWIMVHLNGIPIGHGNPAFMMITTGELFNFYIDDASLRANVIPGAVEPVLYPVDAGGNRILDVWNAEKCQDKCMMLAEENLSLVQVFHSCYPDDLSKNLIVISSANNGTQDMQFIFHPEYTCSKSESCDNILKEWSSLKCYQCIEGQNSFQPCGECYDLADNLQNCSHSCAWVLVARFQTKQAGICILNATYKTRPLVSTPQIFRGTILPPGNVILTILPSFPSPLYSTLHEWNISLLSLPTKYLNATADDKMSIQLALILRDQFGNLVPAQLQAEVVRVMLYSVDNVVELGLLDYDSSFRAIKIQAPATRSGNYMMQLYFLPSLEVLAAPPLDIVVQPSLPLPKNTILLTKPQSVIASAFNTFYMQARDRFGNFVLSSAAFFQKETYGKRASGFAPGFRIWAVKTSDLLLGHQGLFSQSSLKNSVRGCPQDCGGLDPGTGSLQGAFQPADIGEYSVKVQFCDPIVYPGGAACLDAYDLTLLEPPMAPNPCSDLPTGTAGPRHGLACDIIGVEFTTYAGPDRITKALIRWDEIVLGEQCQVVVLPMDRNDRNAGLHSTTCRYTIEFSTVLAGNCTYVPSMWAFEFFFTPLIAGTYSISVFIDEVPTNDSPSSKTVFASIERFNSTMSDAIGEGIKKALAGWSSTFEIYLRDHFGNLIPRHYTQSSVGNPYPEDCGYAFPTLLDGTKTIGYGLTGAQGYGPSSGCRFAFQMYLVNLDGSILRPVSGFTILSIVPLPSGQVQIRYSVEEPGMHDFYVRYLPNSNAGFILHDPRGYLSLKTQNSSREGQIHGSPFRVVVHPFHADASNSRIVGFENGYLSTTPSSLAWTGFDIRTRDRFYNLVACNGEEVNVLIIDPAEKIVDYNNITSGSSVIWECKVEFPAALSGKYKITIKIREVEIPGSPFSPMIVAKDNSISLQNSLARVITSQTSLPCYEQSNVSSNYSCYPEVRAGQDFYVRISPRGDYNNTPEDGSVYFKIRVFDTVQNESLVLRSTRIRPGEHSVIIKLTMSGHYTLSVFLQASSLRFAPHLEKSASFLVRSGESIDARSCLLNGNGLSVATVGLNSVFYIFPKDKYGNKYFVHPSSVDALEDMPGRGIFQVMLKGPGNSTVWGGVSLKDPSTFQVTYLLTISGQYFMFITVLEHAPSQPPPSPLAVSKLGVFSDIDSGSISTLKGQTVTKIAQPFNVYVRPNLFCIRPVSSLLCNSSSYAQLINTRSNNITAGESFVMSVSFRDQCGNPSPSFSGSEIKLHFDGIGHSANISTYAFGETDLFLACSLSLSGKYRIQVFIMNEELPSGVTSLFILPSSVTNAKMSTVTGFPESFPILRDPFSFTILARDIYGNERSSGWDSFHIALKPFDQPESGQSGNVVNVTDLMNGRYDVKVYQIKSRGRHFLNIYYSRDHIQNSPYLVEVSPSNMFPDYTSAYMPEHVEAESPQEFANSSNFNMYAGGKAFLRLAGRDEAGLSTRLGLDELSICLNHSALGIVTLSHEDIINYRTQPLCVETEFGQVCEEPRNQSARSRFSFEILQDEVDYISSAFGATPNASCRSLSGSDEESVVFSNTFEKSVQILTQSTIFNSTSNTSYISNITSLVAEKHPISVYSMNECKLKCLEYYCSCSTFIQGTDSYKDGTCIIFRNATFLQRTSKSISLLGYTALEPDSITIQRWYERKPHGDIVLMFSCEVPGDALLFIQLGGINIGGSPFHVNVIAGLFDILSSHIWIADLNGSRLPLLYKSLDNKTIYACRAHVAKNYTLFLQPKDQNGNSINLDFWSTQMPIRLLLASAVDFHENNHSLNMKWMSVSMLSTSLSIFESGIYTVSILWRTLHKSQLILDYIPDSPCRIYSTNQSKCEAPCIFQIPIAPDCYGNVISNTPSIECYVFDKNIEALIAANFSRLTFNVTKSNSFFEVFITRAGNYEFVISILDSNFQFLGQAEVLPSVTFFDTSKVELKGIGLKGAVLHSNFTNQFTIMTFDAFGNEAQCLSRYIRVRVSINSSRLAPSTYTSCGSGLCAPTFIKNGTPDDLPCIVQFWPAINMSHRIDVEVLNRSVFSKDIQIWSGAGDPSNISAECAMITFDKLSKGISLACNVEETLIPAGSQLRLKVVATDIHGFPSSFLEDPVLVMQHCDPIALFDENCNKSNFQSSAKLKLNKYGVGLYGTNKLITSAGQYWVRVLYPDLQVWSQLYIFNISAGITDLSQISLIGQGLYVAILDYPNSFKFQDKDSYGNLRVSLWSIPTQTNCTFAAHILQGKNIIPARVEDMYSNLRLSTGNMMITYTVSASQFLNDCSSYLETIYLQVLYCDSPIFTNQVSLRCLSTFVPGFASVDPLLRSENQTITAGDRFTFTVFPKDQLGYDISPSFERLFVKSDNYENLFSVHSDSSHYFVNVIFTASGLYTISVLDGSVSIRASPFQVKVIPGDPVPGTCSIYAPHLQASFVQEATQLQGTVSDKFGNHVASSFPIISIFLRHTKGLEDIQAGGDSQGMYESFSYVAHYSGDYIMTIYVQGISAAGGTLDNGIFQTLISASGSVVKVLTFRSDPEKSRTSGDGLSISTAGTLATFSIFSRDSFANPWTLGNDVFYSNLIGPVNISCLITNKRVTNKSNTVAFPKQFNISLVRTITTDEYLAMYYATVSGFYYLTIMATGIHLPGSPFLIKINVGKVSASHSELLQDVPTTRYYAVVNLVPVSSTSSLADGSFLRTVGNNSFFLALRDNFGNQVDYDSFYSCCEHRDFFNITAFMTPQVVEVAGNVFLMSDAGYYVDSINTNKSINSTNSSSLKNASRATISLFQATKINLNVLYVRPGLRNIQLTCTAAGKYRLQVLINGERIARHIPIEEMQSSGENLTASFPDCCVPLTDLCPSAKTANKVCGDLVTFVPSKINVVNSAISGSAAKEFRYYVDGDGEGNKQYPIFYIVVRDEYGNTLTSSLTEFLVTIINMNGTAIVKQPAVSVQPTNPQLICRTSILDNFCGKFQYAWTSDSASKSGLYKVQVTYNGLQIGQNSSFITIRSREADSKTAQIFGPGLQVNLFNARTYFFFRVFDVLLNPWEPDCCLAIKPGPVNIDFGTPTSFGLNRGQRLMLNTTPADNRTRLIYLGFGLFKVEYAAVGPIGPGSGSIQIFYGQSILAKSRPLKGFIPATIADGYAENAPVPLYPVANVSFATGSALYDHSAGDTVDLYIHAISGLNSDPTVREGWWPAVTDYPGKYFVVEVQGPAGTKPLRFIPKRETGEFPWRFHLSWTLTVSGQYTVFVEYDSVPVQGDSSTDYITMPISPWVVQVHAAPVAPSKTTLIGQGISLATVGKMASFLIVTKDIFGNQISPDNFYKFKESENVNATLLGAWGSSILLDIQSQGDGSYSAFYISTQAGSYALTVMIDGISVRVPPKSIYVYAGSPSSATTRWQVSSSDHDQQYCLIFPLYGDICAPRRPAGSFLFVNVEIRDAANNSITITPEAFGAAVRAEVDGKDFEGLNNMVYSGGAWWSNWFTMTATGCYQLAIFLENTQLSGSPINITVVASSLFVPNCYLGGEGMYFSMVNHESLIFVHGRDAYGNEQSMEEASVNATVQQLDIVSLHTRIIIEHAHVISVKYTPYYPGRYIISVTMIDDSGDTKFINGSGSIVKVSLQTAPSIMRASFVVSGAAILVEFDQLTDMGCIYGVTHSLCVESASSHVGDCSFFLDNSTVQSLGAKSAQTHMSNSANSSSFLFPSNCAWRSPQEFVITLGFRPTINVGDNLRFLPKIRNEKGSSECIAGSIPIDFPVTIVVPTVILRIQQDKFQCSSLKLIPESALGGLCRSVRYVWSVVSINDACDSNSSHCRQLVESDQLSVSYDRIFSAEPLNIFLYAYNLLGGNSHAAINTTWIQSEVGGKLRIEIDKGDDFEVSRRDAIEIGARVRNGGCDFGVNNVSFTWSLSSPGGTAQAVSSAPTFRVDRYTLVAGTKYRWRLLVTYALDRATFSKEKDGFLYVSLSPLRALLAGGNNTVPSQSSIIVLDASMSLDPDNSPYVPTFSWRCQPVLKLKENLLEATEVSPLPCFYDAKRILVQNTSILNLTGMLSAGITYCQSCVPGTYSITVNFTKQPADRWSSATAIVKVLNETFTSPVAGVLPLASSVISESRLKLDGIETSGMNISFLSFQWTVLVGDGQCCSGFFNMSDISLFPAGTSSRYIIIKPNSLVPGIRYILRFTVRHLSSGASSSSDLYVNVQKSPHSGSVSVFPSSGTSAVTGFKISCQYWSADEEEIPLSYEYRFVVSNESNVREEISLDQSFNQELSWILPAYPSSQKIYFIVYVGNALGATFRASVPAQLFSSMFPFNSAMMRINSTLSDEITYAIGIFRYDLAFQYFHVAESLFNLHIAAGSALSTQGVVASRALDSLSETIMDTRLRIFRSAFALFQNADYTEAIMISRMLVSIQYLTAVPSNFPASYLDSVMSTTRSLLGNLIKLQREIIQMAQVTAQILANIIAVCSELVDVEPSQPNLALASSIMKQVPEILQLISILSIASRVPGDEHVVVWTRAFAVNTLRISPFDLADQSFSVASLLPSQQDGNAIQHNAIYTFPRDLVSSKTIEIRIKAGEFEYGIYPYPETAYDPIEKFPMSQDSGKFKEIASKYFGPVPLSQLQVLKTAYIDVQVLEWEKNPFLIQERNRTQINEANYNYGQLVSFACSSAFIDCTVADHMCIPPTIDGNRAPSYRDLSCFNSFDADSDTSWAVNPSYIESPDGTGSNISLVFKQEFTWSILKYQQRKGPRFCKGSKGIICFQSSHNCSCIPGGDRLLAIQFYDRSTQYIELENTYEMQEFKLIPIRSSRIVVTVISVYSNPRLCPQRSACAWWEPTCADWCPNGAASIEFLSAFPLVQV